ncbi:putative carbohydrate-binding module family 19 protein [Lyophyllum shimeji]|uniref:Carbohydrate-binding module family 19 protein n=1 Tax=Lyophyllum shimeji TaxID=47721 RepID=A0A9P3PUZ8_LYOSH|nr:putative carbohydrate-binding module family 19 protein [Lyophyllum shimeji]
MVQLSLIVLGLIASGVQGAPLNKRIAQTISASTAKWEQACLAAGGGQKCNPVSVTAFTTLLAAAGPCEQQNAADQMIDLAKELNNDAQVIRLAQIFAQQPRNTPTSQSVPYCQQAPKNAELNGLFQCQFAGANQKVFVGGVAVGQPGTIPFGKNAPVSPPGSCPANPQGPIADGTQLVDITQNPGVGSAGNGNAGNTAPQTSKAPPAPPASTATVAPSAPSASAPSPPASSAPANTGAGGFKLQNGKDAQALNAKFKTLNANSACNDGEDGCVNGGFAQCVNGKFIITQCAGGLTCQALPLVNKPGTSVTCTTADDAAARIAATGATGGVDGAGGAAPAPSASGSTNNAVAAPAAPAAAAPAANGFKLQNGKDAQDLNAKFRTLTASSACNDGENACVNGGFAQCVNGKFVTTQCSGGLTCAALPLVNKPGTSITCTTAADAAARIQATGATGGITGA